jgi:hypothetical protein
MQLSGWSGPSQSFGWLEAESQGKKFFEGLPSSQATSMLSGAVLLRENGLFFECFPYVCPEPVLVK